MPETSRPMVNVSITKGKVRAACFDLNAPQPVFQLVTPGGHMVNGCFPLPLDQTHNLIDVAREIQRISQAY